MRKILALIFMVFLIAGTAVSENKMITEINASGGGVGSAAGNSLQMIFGVPWGGETTVSGNTMRLSILWGASTTITTDEADNGIIRGTTIKRDADSAGSGITLSFYSANPSVTAVDVYSLSGDGTEFSSTEAWTKLNSSGIAVAYSDNGANKTSWSVTNTKVGDGKNAYYKVVPAGITKIFGKNALGEDYNSRTVGKVDVLIFAPASGNPIKYNFVSIPLVQEDNSLDNVLGMQLSPSNYQGPAPELWGWSGTSFGRQAYLKSSGWKKINTADAIPDFSFEYGAGYFIKMKTGHSDAKITFVGLVNTGTFEYEGSIPLRANLYSTLSDPYPIKIGIGDVGLNSVLKSGAASGLADQIWAWTGNSFGAQSFFKNDGTWAMVSGITQKVEYIEPGKAYLLRRIDPTTGAVIWKFNPFK